MKAILVEFHCLLINQPPPRRWSRPHGRAFDLVMCELKRRLLDPKGRVQLDTDTCTLRCGDDKVVDLVNQDHNSV